MSTAAEEIAKLREEIAKLRKESEERVVDTQTATYARTTNQPKPKIGKSSQLCLFSESERAVRQYPLKRKVDHGLVKSDYAETGSYKKTGENLGISGRSVKRIVLDLGWKKP